MSDLSQFVIPRGFRFGAIRAGLKQSGRTDFALIVADVPASAAAAFTANRVKAAPLLVDAEHLRRTAGKIRVVAINAGNANCAVGQVGLDAAHKTCEAAASNLGCKPEEVFPSSTGVIGVPLPAAKLVAVLPELARSLGSQSDHFQQVAQAIITTDTVEKTAFARVEVSVPEIDGSAEIPQEIRIAGVCKGSGMIHPQLIPHATMLVYILTDAVIEPAVLDAYLRDAIEVSFNRISVDGDTSTNDTVILLANGCSGVRPDPKEMGAFEEGVTIVMETLARQIARDGEGAKKLITIDVAGTANEDAAARIARAIANSPLVKTAIAGSDPNWGRILSAAGNAGVAFDPAKVDIEMQNVVVCRGGLAARFSESELKKKLDDPECSIRFHIRGKGKGSSRFWTCDLTEDYIRINASYRT